METILPIYKRRGNNHLFFETRLPCIYSSAYAKQSIQRSYILVSSCSIAYYALYVYIYVWVRMFDTAK